MAKIKSKNKSLKKGITPIFNAVLCASSLTIFLIFALALLLRFGLVKEEMIPVFNQATKVICICLAAFLSVRQPSENPWFRGLFSGAMYIVAGFIIFSCISRTFSPSLSVVFDLVMAMVIGAIVGAIFSKKVKKEKSVA